MSDTMDKMHQEWMDALDSIEDAVFMHDKDFRVIRCNKAYQRYAEVPLKEIIGRPYFKIFPRSDTQSCSCLQSAKNYKQGTREIQTDDISFLLHTHPITDKDNRYLYSIHILKNITKEKTIEQELQRSKEQFSRLFESIQEGILVLDAKTGLITDANPYALHLLIRTHQECIGKELWEIGLLANKKMNQEVFDKLQKTGSVVYRDLLLSRKDGVQVNMELTANLYETADRTVIQCKIRDISECLKNQKMLVESYNLLQSIIDNAPVRISWKDTDLYYRGCNILFAKDAGLSSPSEIIGKDDFEMSWKEDAQARRIDDQQVLDTGTAKLEYKERQYTPGGVKVWLKIFKVPLRAADGSISGILCVYDDITTGKKTEEQLKLFRTLIDRSSDTIEVLEPWTLRFLDVNDTECETLGYSKEELLNMSILDIDTTFTKEMIEKAKKELEEKKSINFETRHRCKDGSTFPVEVNTVLVELDKPYVISIARNITRRKEAEESLYRSNRALQTLSGCNTALIKAQSENELLKTVTKVIVKTGGYSLAIVDYVEEDVDKTITPVAWSGTDKPYFWAHDLNWTDIKNGRLPILKAIRSLKTHVCHNISKDSSFKRLSKNLLEHGYIANIALPLIDDNRVFGVLSIYSSEVDAFKKEEIKLLKELSGDLAYGIVNLRARVAHEKRSRLFRESLEQSIQTIAATVEARDPYTAGHQRRVSELATAIACEMGLSEEQIKGIHFAAIIHDLGKIHIPAEILSKPTKLNEFEYKLIQMHPQTGYDILKDIKFPWPIATIILQHHEKIDGSGYPQGLKGDEILLESKIVALADVVEAMSSHRPYRPALGIEVALDEIKRGRGSIYEPSVVDSCLRLFNEKKFKFSNNF